MFLKLTSSLYISYIFSGKYFTSFAFCSAARHPIQAAAADTIKQVHNPTHVHNPAMYSIHPEKNFIENTDILLHMD
jgi:hypothetical protein